VPRVAPFLLRFLALAGLALLVYSSAIGGSFLWDDTDWIVGAEPLRSRGGLARIWFEPGAVVQYYPLTYTSWWLDVQLWGLDPLPFHVENVLLHALTAALFGQLLRTLKIPGADVAALLFLLHPVHVESVAWLTERKNVLSGVLYVGALTAWIGYLRGGGRRSWGAALGLFALALAAKTTTVALPVVLVLLTWWVTGGVDWRRAKALVPFFVLAALASVMTIVMERHEGAAGHDWGLSWSERAEIAGRVPWFYLGKLVWPHPLAFVYPRWETGGATAMSLAPLAVLLVFAAVAWRHRGGWGRPVLLGFGSFWVALLPVSGLIDFYFMRYAYVADHFQYLPSLGVIALVAALGAHLARNSPAWRRAVPVVLLAVLLGGASWRQAGMYRDLESLWRGTLARNERAWMPHTNLGHLLAARGLREDAIAHHERALELYPDAFESLNFLGSELARQAAESGDPERVQRALRHFERARAVKPKDPMTEKNIGVMWRDLGDEARALEAWERGLALEPDNLNLRCNLASLLAGADDRTLRDGPRAVQLAESVTADPAQRTAELLWLLTGAYVTAGRTGDARTAATETLQAARLEGHQELARRARRVLEQLP
jgi:tetratricopeptide (TPR) repeat protein